MDDKRCREKDCDGFLDANNFITLQVGGCSISNLGFYCAKCGRLYRWDGAEPIFAKDGHKLFYENGKVVIKTAES